MNWARWMAAIGAAALAPMCGAQYSFTPLGVLPGQKTSQALGVSGDGAVVAGVSVSFGFSKAFRWTAKTGMQDIGSIGGKSTSARAVSEDGVFIVGASDKFGFRWTQNGGIQQLPLPQMWAYVSPVGVSADGTAVAAQAGTTAGTNVARWTERTGFVDLGRLPESDHAFTHGMSADGTTIVGQSGTGIDELAFRWTKATGVVSLGTLPGKTVSEAYAASADGSVIVGHSDGRAFRWTEAGGMKDIGTGIATGVSADGSIVVGSGGPGSDIFYWTANTGQVNLRQLLTSHGIDLSAWSLLDAHGCSGDGRTIIGNGTKNDITQAWVITVPGPCYADCDASGELDIDDFICFQTRFASGTPYADCDDSDEIDIDDFICFQTRYVQGCK